MTTVTSSFVSSTAVPDGHGRNMFSADHYAAPMAKLYLPTDLYAHLESHLVRLGDLVGNELDDLAHVADINPPTLEVRTRAGTDTSEIVKHPSYVALEKAAYADFGLAAMSHRAGVLGWSAPYPPSAKYALSHLFVQAEFGLCCPVSMRDSLARTLKRFGTQELIDKVLPLVTSTDFDFLRQIRGELEIGDAEVDLAVEAIKNDKKILDRSYTDNAIQKSVKELSAKAVAVGVPLGAVYLSGSVVGMSAAGMTSGLASLGFGGVLGLSSMATGIGAAIMLGVVAYKGVRFLSNTGIEEGDKRRESMLQEVIRQSQKTMQIIIEDINELVKQLNSALNSQEIQSEKIQEMQRMFQLLSGSATQVSNKTQQAEVDKQRLNSPEVLDLQRLDACTRSSENKKYKEFILGFYEEGFIIDRNKDDEEVKKPVLRLTRLCSGQVKLATSL